MDKIKANNNFKSSYYSLNKKEMGNIKTYYSLNEKEMDKKENNNLKPTHYFSDSDTLFRSGSDSDSDSDSGYNSDNIRIKYDSKNYEKLKEYYKSEQKKYMYNNKQLNDEQLKKEINKNILNDEQLKKDINKLLQNIEFKMETKNNNEIIEI
jgi:hypothetical protein